jgi:hypothetical protein
MTRPTYRLSTYDPGDDEDADWGWTVRVSGLGLWGLRAALRDFRGRGYEDDVSILVEREA